MSPRDQRSQGNAERLDSCNRPHTFRANVANLYRWYCTKCKGEVSEGEAIWYTLGFEDGLANLGHCPSCKRQIPINGICPYCGGDVG